MKKILIADDKAHIRELVATTIGSGQYEIFEAGDGEQALKIAREEKPELLLLDIGMPRLDGFEVCRILKSDPGTASIHIIMVTAYGLEEHRERGLAVGADDYFVKPFSPTALLDRITKVLEGND
jgi:two-component system alkaline phosphatase synthesis response regulator PhoP